MAMLAFAEYEYQSCYGERPGADKKRLKKRKRSLRG
jgi:hypothetical protein